MKAIMIKGCFNVSLPGITIRNGSGHPVDKVWCPFLFQHIIKYYCKLINEKHRVYRSYGNMKKMFTACPLDGISNTDKLVAQLKTQLKETNEQLEQALNLHC